MSLILPSRRNLLTLPVETPLVPLIIITGESNAAGYALNSDAAAGELAVRSGVQILNNTGLVFEDLDVGTNANIGMGLDNTTHGLEIGIANAQTAGRFGFTPIYLVKSGQSGSTIASWDVGQSNWTTFLSRVDAATALLINAGTRYTPVVFYSQGINDSVASVAVATWKAATIAHFAKIRTLLGSTTRIIVTKLPVGAGGATTIPDYNTAIDEIDASDPYTVSIAVSDLDLRDSAHWSYVGLKIMAERIIDEMATLGTAATPVASPAAGAYEGTQNVTLSAGGNNVYYTDAGAVPTTGATLVSGAVSVASTKTLKAISVKSRQRNSPIASFAYSITSPIAWSTIKKSANITLSNGDLDAVSAGGAGFNLVLGTVARNSGKYYFEIEVAGFDLVNQNFFVFGVGTTPAGAYETYAGGYASSGGLQYPSITLVSSFTAGTATFMNAVVGHVHGIAVDMDAGKMWIADNNNYAPIGGGQDPAAGVNPFATFTPGLTLYPAASMYQNNPTNKMRIHTVNTYSPPSGFSNW